MYSGIWQEMQALRVFIVTGPSGGGKTSYVRRERRSGDVVIDVDYIAKALTLSDQIPSDYSDVLSSVLFVRDSLIDAIASNKLTFGRVFIITTDHAEKIQKKVGGQIVVIDDGIDETLRRIENDPDCDPDRKRKRKDLALKWYYQKSRRMKP